MSERPPHRGGRGGRGDGGHHRGGGRGGRGGHGGGERGGHRGGGADSGEKPKKENILDLAKYMDKQITVKFNGGREGTVASMHRQQADKANSLVMQSWEPSKATMR
ncbi:hypothetical protein IF2G_00991 [Cordyceps javanica]|nr:hypothetical protein IF2G_00991 [Cordyceps javanica]